jgi:hypothetical protein
MAMNPLGVPNPAQALLADLAGSSDADIVVGDLAELLERS